MKLLLTLITFCIFCGTAFGADNRLTLITSSKTPEGKPISIICVGGYKFVLVETWASGSVSIVQIFKQSITSSGSVYAPQPVRCSE